MNTFFSPWDQRGLLLLGVPNLLVVGVYYVKNEGCILEVFIMRLFNQTLSIHAHINFNSPSTVLKTCLNQYCFFKKELWAAVSMWLQKVCSLGSLELLMRVRREVKRFSLSLSLSLSLALGLSTISRVPKCNLTIEQI